jgi:hypothetical protein
LDLGLTERPALVTRALELFVQRPDLADQVQAPGTRLVDVFDRLDRALLILGAPGAGKTTLLLTLARDLLQRAVQDPEQPIPVIFPLSSWATQRRPLVDWLVDALNEQYGVPRKIGQAWVEADQILPLLDGLDEVRAEARAACVEAINTFRQEHGLLPLVVCSRMVDYEAIGTRLRLQGALVVQPLTRAQVESYLAQVGRPLAAVREALGEDPTLWEWLETPLMLTIVTLAYAGEPVGAFRARGTPDARHRDLFAAYVDRMFQRRGASPRYPRQQTERWLTWLAWQMTQHSQTVFHLERLQPDWLPPRQRWVPTQGARLAAGLGGGLLGGLGFGLGFGLDDGLAAGLLGAVIGGLTGYSVDITSIDMVRWSGSRFLSELLLPSGRRLGVGLHVGLVAGLLGGLVYKLYAGLAAGLSSGEIATKAMPNEGIHRSARMALVSGLGGGLLAGLIFGPIFGLPAELGGEPPGGLAIGLVFGLLSGLGVGLATGLRYGGRACLQHLLLRLGLRYQGVAPWQYVDFLDEAAERLFLRKIGGGYSFVHRLLQDHFVARFVELGGAAPQEPEE